MQTLNCNALEHARSHTDAITKLASELECLLELNLCNNISQGCAKRAKMAGHATIYRAKQATSCWEQATAPAHSPD